MLGGGGQVGHAFHAGVLAGLAETLGWDPDLAEVIVGTSAGSGVAALLRGGLTASDIAARATGEAVSEAARRRLAGLGPRVAIPDRVEVVGGRPLPDLRPFVRALRSPLAARLPALAAAALPPGRASTEPIVSGLRRLHGTAWPTRAMWVVAVRRDDGRRVVFGRDSAPPASVGDAVAASCAIPGYFIPVRIDGVAYIDGGAHSPTNADLLAGAGLDIVIIVAPMSAERLPGGLDGGLRGISWLLGRQEARRISRRGTPVVLIEPAAADLAVMGPSSASMEASRRAAVAGQARATTVARLRGGALGEALTPVLG